MMAGAFSVVFKTTVIESYTIALVPAIVFIIICIYAKPSTQITIATIMSACYAIVMTIVVIGTVGTAMEGSLTSPNVAFIILLVLIFILSALMHPEEFTCLIPGALYFILIPTGYLVLTIYYLCNLHIVSWGTRELPKRKSREELEEEKRIAEEKRIKKENRKGVLGWLGLDSIVHETAEVFKQLRQVTVTNKSESRSNTDNLLEELILEIRQNRDTKSPPRCRSSYTMTNDNREPNENDPPNELNDGPTEIVTRESTTQENPPHDVVPKWMINEDPENPSWLRSSVCGYGQIKKLDDRERIFWKQLIKRYLYPITEDKVHQEKISSDLKNMRNNVVFGFFMTSALWVALTMQLQLLQDEFQDTALFIKIPHFDGSKKQLTFEPLGMFFLILFAVILFFQFIGMLLHRWGTILHVLSITDVSCSQQFTEQYKIQEIISKTMELQRVTNIENEPEPDYDDPITDYDDDDPEEEDESSSSMFTDTTGATVNRPPSYHSQEVKPSKTLRRRKSAVFNRRGYSTGRTLRLAFERRFRNEIQREKSSGESQPVEGSKDVNRHQALVHSESV